MKILNAIKSAKFVRGGEIEKNISCSVVGNSGCLLEKSLGNQIDESDIVIRFNNGITQGFEEHVGSKTTHRIMNCHFILNIENESYYNHQKSRFPTMDRYFAYKLEGEKIIFKTDPSWSLWEKKEIINKIREKNEVYFIDSEFYELGKKINGGKEPTNGFVGIMMALKYCSDISCYGFSFYDKSSKRHYYDEIKDDSLFNNHNIVGEKRIVELLEKNNLLRIY